MDHVREVRRKLWAMGYTPRNPMICKLSPEGYQMILNGELPHFNVPECLVLKPDGGVLYG